MPCYHPASAVEIGTRADNGKRIIKVLAKKELSDWARKQANVFPVPCQKCIGCRLEKSRQWAVRCVHEASLYSQNCFITLTFRDACPLDGTKTDPTVSLHKHHFQRFMKRLRKRYPESKIKFYHCGEYGEKKGRPHHHAALFNFDFKDKELWSTRDGIPLYTSKELEQLWPFGHSTVGEVTFESAAYIARYVTKKITGPSAEAHYQGRLPEFSTMSRGGRRGRGIAHGWFDRYSGDLYPKDFTVIRGKKIKIPKYYDRCMELTNPEEYGTIKESRKQAALQNPDNNMARLHAGEVIKTQQVGLLKRSL